MHFNRKQQMKKTIKYTGFFVLAIVAMLGISSCEKVVKVDVPAGETLLVVDAWINDLPGKQTVRLTTTAPVFDGNHTPAANGATVFLTDLNNGKQYSFTENSGTGNYEFTPAATDTMTVETHQYRLTVNWQGNTYTSTSTLNRTTTVDTVGYDPVTEFSTGDTTGYNVWLFGKDKPGPQRDHYWIKAFRNGAFFNESNVINISEDAGGGEATDGMCFIPPNAFFNVIPFDKPLKLNDVFSVEIHSLNKDSYDYLTQLFTQINNSQAGLFAVTPENLRTNIKPVGNAPRVLGWFNMARVSRKSFPVLNYSYTTVYPFYDCP
jgi:hypothetical protein